MNQDLFARNLSVRETVRQEKRLRALGLPALCQSDFAHDNGQDPVTLGIMWKYTEHFEELRQEGTGMIIYGSPGAGKSHAAAEIVNELTDRGYNCYFTNMNNVMTMMYTASLEGKRNLFYRLAEKDLLVLDDLGSEVETSYSNQTFIQIVNTCLDRRIPVIVTTSYHPDALLENSNVKRVIALTRLLKRNLTYTVNMPGERRSRDFHQKQKMEVLVKGAAGPQSLSGFEEPEVFFPKPAKTKDLPGKIHRTAPAECGSGTLHPILPSGSESKKED